MDCVNHSGVNATAYCQNCGRALCAACVRRGSAGQILCEPCFTAWQNVPGPFVAPPPGAPNPTAAAVLGIIPGVGAMYNGQFFKGFLHVIIFAVLISLSDHFGLFGFFIAAWVFYQVFDAHQTAKARRDGMPLPDPLGLNEVGHWFQAEYHRSQGQPPPGMGPMSQGPATPPPAGYPPPPGQAPPGQAPFSNPYQSGYQPPAYTPYGGYPPPPTQGFAVPPAPPIPPIPPVYWRRREPIAAIVLIVLGLLFLLGQFSGRVLEFTWPVLLIGLGAWLIVRRFRDTPPAAPAPPMAETTTPGNFGRDSSENDSQGGSL